MKLILQGYDEKDGDNNERRDSEFVNISYKTGSIKSTLSDKTYIQHKGVEDHFDNLSLDGDRADFLSTWSEGTSQSVHSSPKKYYDPHGIRQRAHSDTALMKVIEMATIEFLTAADIIFISK